MPGFARGWAVIGFCLIMAACGPAKDAAGERGGAKGPPEVGFRVVHPESVPFVTELPARINASQTAEVRPQISGVIVRRLFTEGAIVRQGAPLYQIDSSLYSAAADQAAANLASAEANAQAAGARAARYRPLAAEQAIAQQDYTDAAAAARQTRAAVAQSRAALRTAQIQLRYARVPAPLTGRIGRSLFTEGALVSGNQADPLAVISVLDPIYADIQQSSTDLLRMRRMMAAGGSAPMAAEVRLKLDDGTDYELPGTVEFSEVTSDPATGTVTLRARFPNPQGLLLPGMFARARIAQASIANAFLVPQIALTRNPMGVAQVFVVGPGNTAEARTVTAERTLGDKWVVTAGLKDGDRIITQGLGKARAGKPVKPVPEGSPQLVGRGAGKPGTAGKPD
jgi:membrane fusion protein (multidrug efflux system)